MEKPPERPRERPALLEMLSRLLGGRVRERNVRRAPDGEQPQPVDARLLWDGEPLQLPSDGVGPIYHRRYQVDIVRPQISPEELMQRVKANLASFAPRELAEFVKVKGQSDDLQVGDEFQITILGPWNGGVRTIDVTPTSFSFVTLKGHPEAGQIRFQAKPHPSQADVLRFAILSWARSRDMLVSLGYKEGIIGREVQKNAWVSFCERVVEVSGGELLGEIEVINEERKFTGEVVPIV